MECLSKLKQQAQMLLLVKLVGIRKPGFLNKLFADLHEIYNL